MRIEKEIRKELRKWKKDPYLDSDYEEDYRQPMDWIEALEWVLNDAPDNIKGGKE